MADPTLQGALAGRAAEGVGLSEPALGRRIHAGLVEIRCDDRTQHVSVERGMPYEVVGFTD